MRLLVLFLYVIFCIIDNIGRPRQLMCDGKPNSTHVTTGHLSEVVDDLYPIFSKQNTQASSLSINVIKCHNQLSKHILLHKYVKENKSVD